MYRVGAVPSACARPLSRLCVFSGRYPSQGEGDAQENGGAAEEKVSVAAGRRSSVPPPHPHRHRTVLWGQSATTSQTGCMVQFGLW